MKKILLKILLPFLSRFKVLIIYAVSCFTVKSPVSIEAQKLLRSLRLKGYAIYKNEEFAQIADKIHEQYYVDGEDKFHYKNEFILNKISSSAEQIGNQSCKVSFGDPLMRSVMCSSIVWEALNGYIGRCYHRESPLVELYAFCNAAEATRDIVSYAVSFHTDYYRQLNVMLLLTDVTENDTCTEYAVGSHRRNVLIEGVNIGYPKTNELLSKGGYKIEKIIGRKGDLVVMDTTGIHRARVVEGSTRKMLIGVINCNYPFHGYSEKVHKEWFNGSNSTISSVGIKNI
jgi:hypothetical protein